MDENGNIGNIIMNVELDSIIINLKEWDYNHLFIVNVRGFIHYPISNTSGVGTTMEYHILLERKESEKIKESVRIYFASKQMAREYLKIFLNEIGENHESVYDKLGNQYKI
jgi:hypothetical protein